MTAFCAAKESDLTFIGRSQLAEPPFCGIVAALRAFDVRGGECGNMRVAVYNGDLLLRTLMDFCHILFGFDIADISTFTAFQLAASGDHKALAVWTEHHWGYLVGNHD